MYSDINLLSLNVVVMIINLLCAISVRNSGFKVQQRARELDKVEKWLDDREVKLEKIIESRNIVL